MTRRRSDRDATSLSLLAPTRSRPENVVRLWRSAVDTASDWTRVELVLYIDRDDPRPPNVRALCQISTFVTVIRGERINLGETWNRCLDHAIGDVVMQCSDDIVFRSPDWDTHVLAEFEAVPDRIALVHGDDGHWGARFGTHCFVHRRWIDAIGTFLPGFSCDYNDTWLNDVANELGRRRYLPNVITEHMHFVFGKAELDETHRERMANGVRDNVDTVYLQRAPERSEWVARLRAAIDA